MNNNIILSSDKAYIGQISKKDPKKLLNGSREIEEKEIIALIDWFCKTKFQGKDFDINNSDGTKIHIRFE